LPKVEVDEVLGLVSYVTSEVAAYDAVPSGVVLLVEFFLDEGSDVLEVGDGGGRVEGRILGKKGWVG
jgi:hypothetical protein